MVQVIHRLALQFLYLGWRIKSHIFGGTIRCAVAALWVGEELLMVKQSYRRIPMLPGGIVDRGETPEKAVIREIREELGLDMEARDLKLAIQNTYSFEGRQEQTWLFEGAVPAAQTVVVDGREILSAWTVAPSVVLATSGGQPCLLDYLSSRV